jgi:hypothetical protein
MGVGYLCLFLHSFGLLGILDQGSSFCTDVDSTAFAALGFWEKKGREETGS